MIGAAMAVMIGFDEFDRIRPTRLITPLSRTAGVWVTPGGSGGNVSRPPAVSLGGRSIGMNAGCEPFNNTVRTSDGKAYTLEPYMLSMGTLDSRWLMLASPVVCIMLQTGRVINGERAYNEVLADGNTSVTHFFQRGINVLLHFIVIGVQLGITDFTLLVSLSCNVWAAAMLFMLAELLLRHTHWGASSSGDVPDVMQVSLLGVNVPYCTIAHVTGWIAMATSAVVVCSNLMHVRLCIANHAWDSFLWLMALLVWAEVGIMGAFCFAQLLYLAFKRSPPSPLTPPSGAEYDALVTSRAWWACRIELLYIVLEVVVNACFVVMVYVANL